MKSDYTFAGKDNQATGKVTWNELATLTVQLRFLLLLVIHADKAVAGGKTVTPDAPEQLTP